ncbi:amidase family protein [Marinovum sp. 2_MG-2023]|uniref:amidase family protein n=1 Tax=unclassified Marinovum TaxID=2647166 RepID=UPI0026E3526C|nr:MULTISPECIES: amidase family protein [unclassified Marinovum]MDO6729605.1 amidase family protein [Marinovum sp. 2_MG-2023]MDO6780241.1 amidase family protein [Marinovum sp. 1_MG-2023]
MTLTCEQQISGAGAGAGADWRPATDRAAAGLAALEGWTGCGACTAITPDRAMKQAAQVDTRMTKGQSLGPLDGVHVVWKDIIDQADEVTTCGSGLRKSAPPARHDAHSVARIEAAGAVSLARTGLSEFAFSGLGLNPHFGTPPSALSTDVPLVPGGSSSGAAVLVAHNLADLGVGTDTSGSIRLPAALNGIFGFRPSAARYDKTGVYPLSRTLDTLGTLSHSFDVLRAADGVLTTAAPRGGRKEKAEIWELSDSLGPVWGEEVARAYDAALVDLSAAGWVIKSARLKSVDDLHALTTAQGQLVAIEARRNYADLLASDQAAAIDPMIRTRLEQAPVLSDAQYASYLRTRAQLVRDAQAEIGERLVAFPTVPSLRHALSDYQGNPDAAQDLNSRLLGATMIGSLLDWPGLALPLRENGGRVQGSILLSAASGNDDHLLAQTGRIVSELTNATFISQGESYD